MPTTHAELNVSKPAQIPSNEEILKAVQEGVQDALWRHRRLGETIVCVQDDEMVFLTGDEIPVDEETIRRNEAQRRREPTN